MLFRKFYLMCSDGNLLYVVKLVFDVIPTSKYHIHIPVLRKVFPLKVITVLHTIQ